MKVLVTGATGGIGCHVTEELLAHGHEVSGLCLEPPPTAPAGITWFAGDARDPVAVERAAAGASAVVHLAAMPSPVGHPPEQVFANNTVATFVVLEVAGRVGIPRAVVTSSMSALGFVWADRYVEPRYVPIDEDHPLLCEEAYGLSKQVDETTAQMMARRWGLDVLVFRLPLTTTGATLRGWVEKVRADPGLMASHLWGYLDVRDAAEAFRRGLEAEFTGSQVINVAAPQILGLHGSEQLVRKYHPATVLRRSLEGDEVPFDLARMRDTLGFEPRHHWRELLQDESFPHAGPR